MDADVSESTPNVLLRTFLKPFGRFFPMNFSGKNR